jgi:transcription antitermination factor NusG
MREQQQSPFSVIFDPISKSALIQVGDCVTFLSGPFANYREALRAADRCMAKR